MRSVFQVPGVQFAVANNTNYTYSGVLGLGYSYPFTTKYPTLLSMMWALGYIAAPVFSMSLGGDGDGFSEPPPPDTGRHAGTNPSCR